MTVGMSPESGSPSVGSTAVAGSRMRSALDRRESVRPWKNGGAAIHHATIATTPSASAPMPTTATAP